MLKTVMKFLFRPKQPKLMSEKDLEYYMRIEHVTYSEVFPPPFDKRGK